MLVLDRFVIECLKAELIEQAILNREGSKAQPCTLSERAVTTLPQQQRKVKGEV